MKSILMTVLLGGGLLAAGCCTHSASGSPKTKLVILKATYGVGVTNTVDVTAEIRSLVKKDSVHLHPQWGFGIDPAYGARKRVTIAYQYHGQIEVASFDQFEELVLPVEQ